MIVWGEAAGDSQRPTSVTAWAVWSCPGWPAFFIISRYARDDPHPPQCAHWGTFPRGKAWSSGARRRETASALRLAPVDVPSTGATIIRWRGMLLSAFQIYGGGRQAASCRWGHKCRGAARRQPKSKGRHRWPSPAATPAAGASPARRCTAWGRRSHRRSSSAGMRPVPNRTGQKGFFGHHGAVFAGLNWQRRKTPTSSYI